MTFTLKLTFTLNSVDVDVIVDVKKHGKGLDIGHPSARAAVERRLPRDMALPRPDRVVRQAQHRRAVQADGAGTVVVSHPTHPDRHHEHGGVRGHCEDVDRRRAAAIVLHGG